MRSETPKKDRLAMLEQYRQQQKRIRENIDEDYAITKRSGPPLPRTTAAPSAAQQQHLQFAAEGSSALERFRMRKQQKMQQHQILQISSSYDDGRYGSFYDEPDETGTYNVGSMSGFSTAPHTHARSLAANRTHPIPTGTVSYSATYRLQSNENSPHKASLSQETEHTGTLSQLSLSQESMGTATVGTIESVARVEEMQKRLRQLEEEKVGITIAMAPLEARYRQKEDAWLKEQNRLLTEIESLKQEAQKSNERYRDLLAQYEAQEEEMRQLREQIRKHSSSRFAENATGSISGWSRHTQLDRDITELREKLQNAEEEIKSVRLGQVSVEKELHATQIERDSILRAYEELQEEYDEIAKSTSDNREAEIKLHVLTTEHIATSAQLNAVCSDLAATKATFQAKMEETQLAHSEEIEKYKFEVSVLKTRASSAVDFNKSARNSDVEDFAILKARIEERDRKIAALEAERLTWEATRRQMHNRIQELRGNIRVFVRTRPFLPGDGDETVSAIDVAPDGESLSIFDTRTGAPFGFKFDKVFPPSTGQDHVFDEVSDFVQSALDGYNVCLFSYGQTGSGKTHTMQGSGNGAMRGIIPRAVEKILTEAKAMHNQKWKFSLSASFLEIYNEDLKDLLLDMSGDKSFSQNPPKLAIKRNSEGKGYVENLTEISIETTDTPIGLQQLDALMSVAARSRSVASTKMNAQSSRSHSVFILNLRGYNIEDGTEVQGSLNLCDLAGSERLDRSGAHNDAKRLRETQAINKSLSCLGDVFNALATKASHVPYRNSKLTYLLQDCLSGDGKALMFVNLSPTNASSNESLCSLRFAQRVNQVELGKATKHIQYRR
jgi:kinesin family protein C1